MTATAAASISPRETEVLAAVGTHLTNAQIAVRMHLSVRTVESHVSALLRKLDVSDRRALAELAPRLAASQMPPARLIGLPTLWTTFVGRAREAAVVVRALDEARLVTLIGPGGVGKTRLAVEVARAAGQRFQHGGGYVELVPVRADFLVQAVAATLGVTGRAGQRLDDALVEHLAARHVLLVLDNCEHLLAEAADVVARLLTQCPKLTVLATSQERLGVPGERVIAVPPLSLISDEAECESEAVRLFVERASAADDRFTDQPASLAELCGRLDGMPLAIELAAARVSTLGAAGLIIGLGDRLRLLAGGRGSDERHRSLRSVLDWSFDLLDDDERRFLCELAVFAAGFDLIAATAVTAVDGPAVAVDLLGRLADKSLIVHQRESGPSRWQLLETVRCYALEKLAANDGVAAVRARHLRWAARVGAELEQRLGTDQSWRADFDLVADDLRAALALSDTDAGRATAYQLGMSAGHLAFARRFYEEAIGHLERAARTAPDAGAAALAMRAAADVGQAAVHTGSGFERLLEAADLAATSGDAALRASCLARAVIVAHRFPGGMHAAVAPSRLAALLDEARRVAPPGDAVVTAELLQAAAWNGSGQTLLVEPRIAAEALEAARSAGDAVLVSGALDAVATGLSGGGHSRDAFRLSRERLEFLATLPRHLPSAAYEITDILHMIKEQAIAAGELPTALKYMREAQNDDVMTMLPFNAKSELVVALVLTGGFSEAMALAMEMWSGWQAASSPAARWMTPAALAAALACGLTGEPGAADEWTSRAQRLIGDHDLMTARKSAGFASFTIARLGMHAGDLEKSLAASASIGVATSNWYDEHAHWYYDAYNWALDAELAVIAGLPDAPARLHAAQSAADENRWAGACLDRAHGRMTNDVALLERAVTRWEEIDARFERACTLLLLPNRAADGRAELEAIGATLPATY